MVCSHNILVVRSKPLDEPNPTSTWASGVDENRTIIIGSIGRIVSNDGNSGSPRISRVQPVERNLDSNVNNQVSRNRVLRLTSSLAQS